MSFDRDRPFDALPPLPPPVELETKPVLKRVIAARTALAELKGAGALIPDPSILIRTIGLQEARLSSEIENVVTQARQTLAEIGLLHRVRQGREVYFLNIGLLAVLSG